MCGGAHAEVRVTQVTQRESSSTWRVSSQHCPAPSPSPQVALGSLFHGLDVVFLQPTSLTLLYPLASPSNSTDVYVEPMEITTFRLRLG